TPARCRARTPGSPCCSADGSAVREIGRRSSQGATADRIGHLFPSGIRDLHACLLNQRQAECAVAVRSDESSIGQLAEQSSCEPVQEQERQSLPARAIGEQTQDSTAFGLSIATHGGLKG